MVLGLMGIAIGASGGIQLAMAQSGPAKPNQAKASQNSGLSRAVVLIKGKRFEVEVAETAEQQHRGLGGRKMITAKGGMLFPYAKRARHGFWMLDMRFPIDIIWLDNNRVVDIAARVPPMPEVATKDLPVYRPSQPANLVLELAAGEANALKLQKGDTMVIQFLD